MKSCIAMVNNIPVPVYYIEGNNSLNPLQVEAMRMQGVVVYNVDYGNGFIYPMVFKNGYPVYLSEGYEQIAYTPDIYNFMLSIITANSAQRPIYTYPQIQQLEANYVQAVQAAQQEAILKESQEKARLEAERKRLAEDDARRAEELRLEQERQAHQKAEQERLEQERQAQQRAEQERQEQERQEQERQEQERQEQERQEQERQEQERQEQERQEAEQQRIAQERVEQEPTQEQLVTSSLDWDTNTVEQPVVEQPVVEQPVVAQPVVEQPVVAPNETTEAIAVTNATVESVQRAKETKKYKVVPVVKLYNRSIVGFESVDDLREVYRDIDENKTFASDRSIKLYESLGRFINRYPSTKVYDLAELINTMTQNEKGWQTLYDMTRFDVETESYNTLYDGFYYVQYLYLLFVTHIEKETDNVKIYQKMKFFIKRLLVNSVFNDDEETFNDDDSDDEDSVVYVQTEGDYHRYNTVTGLTTYIDYLLNNIVIKKTDNTILSGLEKLVAINIYGIRGIAIPHIDRVLSKLGLNECRIVIKENGMEITKSGVKLCPEVIGFYHRILEVREGAEDEILNMDYNQILEMLRDNLPKGMVDFSQYIKFDKYDKVKFTPVSVIFFNNVQFPMMLVGKDEDRNIPSSKKYIALPIVGEYILDLESSFESVLPLKLAKTKNNFSKELKDIGVIEVGRLKELENNKDIEFININVDENKINSTFFLSELKKSYPGIYIPAVIMKDINDTMYILEQLYKNHKRK